jgi:hypothetical protein
MWGDASMVAAREDVGGRCDGRVTRGEDSVRRWATSGSASVVTILGE